MDKYAVIGNPIDHSKSPEIHARFAMETGEQIEYGRFLSTEENFERDVKKFFETGKGLNVTLPFKLLAMNFADELSERARLAGAVNTLIKNNGKILGDNTDGLGLVRDLKHNCTQMLSGKTVLIIGAGGAAQGVMLPLFEAGVKKIVIANRTLEKAESLQNKFNSYGKIEILALDGIPQLDDIDLIINASSAGLEGKAAELPASLANVFCYDMVYGKKETPFIKQAKEKGCLQYADGLGMLVEQAAESFFLWRGIRPETGKVLEHLRASL